MNIYRKTKLFSSSGRFFGPHERPSAAESIPRSTRPPRLPLPHGAVAGLRATRVSHRAPRISPVRDAARKSWGCLTSFFNPPRIAHSEKFPMSSTNKKGCLRFVRQPRRSRRRISRHADHSITSVQVAVFSSPSVVTSVTSIS